MAQVPSLSIVGRRAKPGTGKTGYLYRVSTGSETIVVDAQHITGNNLDENTVLTELKVRHGVVTSTDSIWPPLDFEELPGAEGRTNAVVLATVAGVLLLQQATQE